MKLKSIDSQVESHRKRTLENIQRPGCSQPSGEGDFILRTLNLSIPQRPPLVLGEMKVKVNLNA